MDERRLIETCDLPLERELLQAACSGTMPSGARRRALSALGLLVLVKSPAATTTMATPASGRARSSRRTHPLIKLATLLAVGAAATTGTALYLGRQAHDADEHVGPTRIAWHPASSLGAEPASVEPALPGPVPELDSAVDSDASSSSELPQAEPPTAR